MIKKQEQIHFRKWVKDLGFRNAAKILGCTYESCRFWVNDKGTPTIPTAKKILKESKGKVDPASFFNNRAQ